jgi:DNA-binding transcriptional LysR family regulator
MADIRTLTFDQLAIFIAVVESGSLTRAAERLGIGKTTVSTAIQRLESEVGAGLLVRTTRRLSVTEAGQAFFKACQTLLNTAEEALCAASRTGDNLNGTLRVASSVEYSAVFLAPVLAKLRHLHPKLKVDLVSGDRFVDLIEEGIDVAIRLGRLTDSTLRLNKICDYANWLVARPDFVAAHALRDDVSRLSSIPYVALSVLTKPFQCQLKNGSDELRTVDFTDGFTADTVYACRAAALAGAGIALLPDFSVAEDIEAKRLVRVFPQWATKPSPIHALLPPGRFTAPKSRIFIEMLKKHVSSLGSDNTRHT